MSIDENIMRSSSKFFKARRSLNENINAPVQEICRKPILKKQTKHFRTQQADKNQNTICSNQNGIKIQDYQNEKENTSINMKQHKQKKRSMFLKLQDYSQNSNNQNKSKRLSFDSVIEQKSSRKLFNEIQSKIEIMYSSSNISDFSQSSDLNFINMQLPSKSKILYVPSKDDKKLNSYELTQVNDNKILIATQQMKRQKPNENEPSPKTSIDNRLNSKLNKFQSFSNVISPKSTNSTGFGLNSNITYDQQSDVSRLQEIDEVYTIIQSPPLSNISNRFSKAQKCTSKKLIEDLRKKQDQTKKLVETYSIISKRQFLDLKHPFLKRQSSSPSIQNSLAFEKRGLSFNSPTMIKQNYEPVVSEFQQKFLFQINIYRFINRLIYTIQRYLSYDEFNDKQIKEVVKLLIIKKHFVLLNCESFVNQIIKKSIKDQAGSLFKAQKIVQSYFKKEQVYPEFKQSMSMHKSPIFSLDTFDSQLQTVLFNFLVKTLFLLQKDIQFNKSNLMNGRITKQIVLIQVRLKLLNYLFFDLLQGYLSSKDFNKSTAQRMSSIIQKDEWNAKINVPEAEAIFSRLMTTFIKKYQSENR